VTPSPTPRPKPEPCGCLLDCPLHRSAPDLLAALEDVNRLGLGSAFAPGSQRMMALLNAARGAK
jgi:hypothetical protein